MSIDPAAGGWQGPRIRLRAFEPEDAEPYHAWNADAEQTRGLDHIPFPQSWVATRRWADEEAGRTHDSDNFRFVIENETGEVAGDITVHDCDRRTGCFAYGISIRRDLRHRGYAAEAIGLVLRYYFEELRYQKVTVTVFDFNAASIRLHERLGFQLEGRLRRVVFTGGEFHDTLMYGLTVEEWRAQLQR